MEHKPMEVMQYFQRAHLLRTILNRRTAMESGLFQGQLPMLEYVHRHKGCTQRDVAKEMMVTPASVAVSFKRMEKAGILERVVDDKDARCNQVFLTPKGLALMEECRAGFDTLDATTFQGFTSEELAVFSGFLQRMIKNMSGDEFRNASIHELVAELNDKRAMDS